MYRFKLFASSALARIRSGKQTGTDDLGSGNLALMELCHAEINVVGNGIIDDEEMDGNGDPLTNTDGAAHSLMDDSGIPVLRKKEDASTELEIDTGSASDDLDNDDDALGRRSPCFCDGGADSL
jgi:hypothetical protein